VRAPAAALLALLVYVAARGALLLLVVPPWQGPDEPGHALYALTLSGAAGTAAGRERVELEILASMDRHRFYDHLGIARPARPPRALSEVARLGGDPTQLDNETPVGYAPYALAAAWPRPAPDAERALLRMRAVSLLLVLLTTLAAAAAAAGVLGARNAVPAAALVAAAPMLGFTGAVVNNDATAALLAAAWFALLARLTRRGAGPGALVAVLLLAALAGAGKRTALYLPLLAGPAVVWLARAAGPARPATAGHAPAADAPAADGSAADAAADAGAGRPAGVRRRWLAAAVLTLLVLTALSWPLPSRAAGWDRVGAPWGAERVVGGRSGHHALRVVDTATDAWQYLEQTVSAAGGARVRAEAWVLAPGPAVTANLVVSDDAGTWLAGATRADLGWRHVALHGRLADGATNARLALFTGDGTARGTGTMLADDVILVLDGTQRLANGGAERPVRLGSAAARALGEYTAAERLLSAVPGGLREPRQTLQRAWRGLTFLQRSFWGGFGWLTHWPGPGCTLAAGGLTCFALIGTLIALIRPRRLVRDAAGAGLLRLCALGAVLSTAAAVAGSMAGWGPDSLPQGRYLLAALVPMALPATALAARLWPRAGPWALAAAALALDAVLLARVTLPGFGRF